MSSPFTNREPLTPAQKKIVVCAVLIVLIMAVSIGYDVFFGRAYTYDDDGSVAEQSIETGTDEEETEQLDEEDAAEEDEEEEASDTLAAGDVYEFDVFSLENATDEDLSLDYDAIETALLNLFSEEGYDGHVGQTFYVVGVGSGEEADGTAIDSLYIFSECDSFEYLRLDRDNGYLDYSAMALETSSAWLTLMEYDGVDTTAAERLVSSASASSTTSDADSDSTSSEAESDE